MIDNKQCPTFRVTNAIEYKNDAKGGWHTESQSIPFFRQSLVMQEARIIYIDDDLM